MELCGRQERGICCTARPAVLAGFTAAALLLSSLQSRASGALVDGEYDCGGGYTYRHMGMVDIRGSQYRYRPYDELGAPFASFSVDSRGQIQWSGKFGELNQPPARIVESKIERFGFNVMYQGTSGGLINTMSCHAPGK